MNMQHERGRLETAEDRFARQDRYVAARRMARLEKRSSERNGATSMKSAHGKPVDRQRKRGMNALLAEYT